MKRLFVAGTAAVRRGAGGGCAPSGPARRTFPILADRLPSFQIPCPLTGEERQPSEVLAGKASLLFFTDLRTGVQGDLARFLAELQTEYAPWLSWVGVLVGPGGAEESGSSTRRRRCGSATA